MVLPNAGKFVSACKASHPRGRELSWFELYVNHPVGLMQSDTTYTDKTTFLRLRSINYGSRNMFPQLLIIFRPSIIITRINTIAFDLLNN